mmetsp:Transcript_16688/g.14184  ORF Transcript_16688/g.14184 Transcript_16688/m.14184 type:complete len:110 (-) Transcript_16688:94-423(-)
MTRLKTALALEEPLGMMISVLEYFPSLGATEISDGSVIDSGLCCISYIIINKPIQHDRGPILQLMVTYHSSLHCSFRLFTNHERSRCAFCHWSRLGCRHSGIGGPCQLG